MAKLTKTSTPGIFRSHRKGCSKPKRCDCKWVVITYHRGRQIKTTCDSFSEAKEAKGRSDSGDRRPAGNVKFGVYFEGWIESYAGRTARGAGASTRAEYKRVIEKFAIPEWETWKLGDVEPADARALLVKAAEEGASPSELKKLRTALSAMFATATEDDGLLRSNPILGVRLPAIAADEEEPDDEEGERAKAMTREELGLILAALPADQRLFFEFLAHTGLRISEAAGLRWSHLHLGGPRVYVEVREQVYRGKRKRLKSKEGKRDVPLSPKMVTRLLAHRRDTYEGDKASVFPSSGKLRKTAEGLAFPFDSKRLAREVLWPAREAIGMEWITFHTFRHSCASMLFARGRNLKQVQKWMGHADPSYTLRTYVHLLDDGVGDADFMDDDVQPAGGGGNVGAIQPPQPAATHPGAPTPDSAA